jgi:hypothetical protein
MENLAVKQHHHTVEQDEASMINIVKSLYTDVFDSGNCPVVNSYYHDDAQCHFKGKILSVDSMKNSMANFVAEHNITTTIESVIAKGDRTFARLCRKVTDKSSGMSRDIEIMVEKRFEGMKVKELWFMVDDDIYSNTWLAK